MKYCLPLSAFINKLTNLEQVFLLSLSMRAIDGLKWRPYYLTLVLLLNLCADEVSNTRPSVSKLFFVASGIMHLGDEQPCV